MTTARTRLLGTAQSDPPSGGEEIAPILGFRRTAYWLSGAVLLVASVASGLTFGVDGVLTGPAAMNGSARGTALVLLVLTVPLLAVAMVLAARGSVGAVIVWLGALAHIAYNAQLFLYGTPFNHLFLMYVAMLGLSV